MQTANLTIQGVESQHRLPSRAPNRFRFAPRPRGHASSPFTCSQPRGRRVCGQINRAAFSATAVTVALSWPLTSVGKTEASAMRRPSMPRTRSSSSTTAGIVPGAHAAGAAERPIEVARVRAHILLELRLRRDALPREDLTRGLQRVGAPGEEAPHDAHARDELLEVPARPRCWAGSRGEGSRLRRTTCPTDSGLRSTMWTVKAPQRPALEVCHKVAELAQRGKGKRRGWTGAARRRRVVGALTVTPAATTVAPTLFVLLHRPFHLRLHRADEIHADAEGVEPGPLPWEEIAQVGPRDRSCLSSVA